MEDITFLTKNECNEKLLLRVTYITKFNVINKSYKTPDGMRYVYLLHYTMNGKKYKKYIATITHIIAIQRSNTLTIIRLDDKEFDNDYKNKLIELHNQFKRKYNPVKFAHMYTSGVDQMLFIVTDLIQNHFEPIHLIDLDDDVKTYINLEKAKLGELESFARNLRLEKNI
jgi:hypothetical protein